ncbi:MAG: Ig-like domain-containing protein, partial [Anaerolineae bacterium]
MRLTASAGDHSPRRYLAAGLIAGLAVAGPLGVASCGVLGRQEPAPEPTVERPSLPPSGPRLASLAVFPAATVPLEVARTQPEDGAQGTSVAKDEARIVVQFSHPVVPLVAPDQQAGLPEPLSIEPPIPGRGEWLNTSTYQWLPSADLAPSTEYTVIVGDNVTDVLGATMDAPSRISFTTATPAVVTTYPAEGAIDAGATRPISVTFNQPMDHASAQAALSVSPSGGGPEATGEFGWLGPAMVLTPTQELERGAEYVASVAAGAKAASASAATAADYSWKFTVAPGPRLVSSTPEDGATDTPALRSEPLFLRFNTPMNTDGVTITIQPTIANRALWWADGDKTARVGGNWIASTAYTVTVKDTSESRFGDEMGDDAAVH